MHIVWYVTTSRLIETLNKTWIWYETIKLCWKRSEPMKRLCNIQWHTYIANASQNIIAAGKVKYFSAKERASQPNTIHSASTSISLCECALVHKNHRRNCKLSEMCVKIRYVNDPFQFDWHGTWKHWLAIVCMANRLHYFHVRLISISFKSRLPFHTWMLVDVIILGAGDLPFALTNHQLWTNIDSEVLRWYSMARYRAPTRFNIICIWQLN